MHGARIKKKYRRSGVSHERGDESRLKPLLRKEKGSDM
jgi:hypothetical protein